MYLYRNVPLFGKVSSMYMVSSLLPKNNKHCKRGEHFDIQLFLILHPVLLLHMVWTLKTTKTDGGK